LYVRQFGKFTFRSEVQCPQNQEGHLKPQFHYYLADQSISFSLFRIVTFDTLQEEPELFITTNKKACYL